MMLEEELDKPPLPNLVPPGSFEIMVFKLIDVSKKNGWTDQLIAAGEKTSDNPRIKKLRETLERSAAIDLVTIDKRVTKPGGLERLVREGGFADWGLWVDIMTDIGRRICRVEYQTGAQMGGGTGFLVAPNLVLTNYHVVEHHILGSLHPTGIRCRFDFAVGSSGTSAGLAFPLAPASGWLVDPAPTVLMTR